MYRNENDGDHPLAQRFASFVTDRAFPCVGAKAALKRNGMRFIVAEDFRSGWDDLRIMPGLLSLSDSYRAQPEMFQSLVVLFATGAPADEKDFEQGLWKRLQSLSDKDEWLGQKLDVRVEHDPEDPHFAMSFGGEAFFVVGLHPEASRPARRFEAPALVFNLHDQFTTLRAEGRYDKLRASILERDEAIAGTINPMLEEHGQISAARQYSGRAVDADWRCPYSGRTTSDAA